MKKNAKNNDFLEIILLAVFFSIVFPTHLFGEEQQKELKLSRQKAIEITLKNNLDIAVERINSKIEDENITLENSFFDPALFADFSIDKTTTPSASAFASPDVTKEDNINFSIGLKQTLKAGSYYELKLNSIRNTTNSTFSGLDPQYSSSIDLDFTQPLLRDFGIDLNTRKIKIATNNRDISQKEFKIYNRKSRAKTGWIRLCT